MVESKTTVLQEQDPNPRFSCVVKADSTEIRGRVVLTSTFLCRNSLGAVLSTGSIRNMDEISRNVEIKAKVKNIDEILRKAKELSKQEALILNQRDVFFNSPNPNIRLKLREENGTGMLISYSRPDTEGPKVSMFRKCVVNDCNALSDVLTHALGKRGVVEKQRFLFVIDQTRVHIDRVTGLGDYMELEVMLKEGQSAEEGQQIAQLLMNQLGVADSDLLAGAYMDMLLPPS